MPNWWDRLRGKPQTYDLSISDPAFAALLQMGTTGLGVYSTYEAMRNPAFFRGVSIIAGTIASLPLRTWRTDPDTDEREESSSFLDDEPSGPYNLTPFTWREMLTSHLVTEGEVGLMHVHNQAGSLIGLFPVSPTQYEVKWVGNHKVFTLRMQGGQPIDCSDDCSNPIDNGAGQPGCFTQILGMSLDGRRGVSPIVLFRRTVELAHAQEVAAMRTMTNGALMAGLISTEEDVDADEAKSIKKDIDEKAIGPEKAGSLVMVNRKLKFTPWTMTNNDAQFLQGREFGVHDVARMLGVPAHLLYSTSKEQSFASGLGEQVAGLQKFTLMPITSRIENALSRLLSKPKFVEFDYKGLLQGTPEEEVKLVLEQLDAGVMSEEEAREKLLLGPKDPTDTFRTPVAMPTSGRPPLEPLPADQAGSMAPSGMNGNGSMR